MMSGRAFYQGDTFDFSGRAVIRVDGIPVSDLTGWTARVQIRTRVTDDLVAEPSFEWLDVNEGLARVYFDGPTDDWAVGLHNISMKFFGPGGTPMVTVPSRSPFEIRKAPVR